MRIARLLAAILAGLAASSDPAPEGTRARRASIPASADAADAWRVELTAATIEVEEPGAGFAARRAELETWIRASAAAIEAWYGLFPVSRLRLVLLPSAGRGVGEGTTFGGDFATIRIALARDVDADALSQDWVLVHELVHVCMPSLATEQRWLEEGSATYIEPLARVRTGSRSPAEVWTEFVRDMPQGLPAAGDRGLDHTPTWGRTYYGGAIFCLTADVEIRERTGNRMGLQDAFAAVVRAGGNVTQSWPIERVIAVGDGATGTTVLAELYASMRAAPQPRELDGLWRELGVELEGGSAVFDDAAPLAGVRRAIAP